MESNDKIQENISQMKELYNHFLSYLENSDDKAFDKLIDFIHANKWEKDKEEFKNLLQLILNVSNHHHRTSNFFEKIDNILQFFKSNIKQFFSNSDIFTIFKSNKRILLFLFEKEIITLDENIYGMMNDDLCQFFYPEIMKLIGEEDSEFFLEELLSEDSDILDNFDEKRHEGENNSYICSLIRKDKIEDFIIHINKTNIGHNSQIRPSIFETNSFLIENNPTLIEYASFFGAIQIVRYLTMNNTKLKPTLWLYAIHGNNPEIIHFCEEYQIKPPKSSYEKCFIESIKCHHNDFANYFNQNYMNSDEITEMNDDVISCIFHYHNYLYFPLNNFNDDVFFYICFYNFSNILNEMNLSPSTMTIEDAVKENKIKDVYYFLSKQEKISQNMIPENKLVKIAIPPSIITIEPNSFNCFKYLQKISIPSSVTSIGDNAFESCTNMTEITIPSSVTYIGENAFKDCTSLRKITIPSSVKKVGSYAFNSCLLLNEVELSNSMNSIESYTFATCRSLKKIFIPPSITQIKTSAFEECVKLLNIRLPSSLKEIGSYAFSGCSSFTKISIPSSITLIELYSFSSCSSLKEISLPYSIRYINSCAFRYCSSLIEIYIPYNVIHIGSGAFCHCTALVSISIPSSVQSIDENTFYGCTSLEEVEIPSSVNSIHHSAFFYCNSLKEIKVHSDPSNPKKLGFPAGVKITYI